MGDDLLDLPVLAQRRAGGGAGRRGAPRSAARVHWVSQPPAAAARCASSSSCVLRARGALGRLVAQHLELTHAGLRDPRRRAGRAARRPGRRQGVGALQARRGPLDRSPARPAVAAFHPRPELSGRRPGRSRDRGTGEGGARSIPARSSCGWCSATSTARRARSAARFRSTSRCCSGRGSTASSTPTCSSASGLDYRRGGFVDRAVAAFTDVLKLDPDNEAALVNLEKLQEDQHQWQEAYVTRQRLAQIAGPPDQPKSQSILAFLENELGLQALKDGRLDEAARRFEAAIDLDGSVIPAYLHLGDVRLQQGDLPGAVATGSERSTSSPDRAYLALDRLERAYASRRRRAPVRRAVPAADARRRRASGGRAWRSPATSPRQAQPARGARAAVRGARAQPARAGDPPGHLEHALAAGPAASRSSRATSRSRGSRSSTSIRTSACAAGIAAPSCSGSARTATNGTRSSKSASRRPPTPKPRSRPASRRLEP